MLAPFSNCILTGLIAHPAPVKKKNGKLNSKQVKSCSCFQAEQSSD